jgi:hypothetical protein
MTILDITPAGAYANALEAAKARERREAAPYVSTAPAVAALPPRLPHRVRRCGLRPLEVAPGGLAIAAEPARDQAPPIAGGNSTVTAEWSARRTARIATGSAISSPSAVSKGRSATAQ